MRDNFYTPGGLTPSVVCRNVSNPDAGSTEIKHRKSALNSPEMHSWREYETIIVANTTVAPTYKYSAGLFGGENISQS